MSLTKFGVFLDADGVLWPDIGAGGILKGITEAKKRLSQLIETVGNREKTFIGVVTNQTLAARAEIPYKEFEFRVFSLFDELKRELLIDDFRACFHHPNASYLPLRVDDCLCRKPRPGMINELLAIHDLHTRRTVIIGDRITDVLAGRKANLDEAILLFSNRMLEVNIGSNYEEWSQLIQFKVAKDFSESLVILKHWMGNDR